MTNAIVNISTAYVFFVVKVSAKLSMLIRDVSFRAIITSFHILIDSWSNGANGRFVKRICF